MNETIDMTSKEQWEKAKEIYLSTLQSPDEKSQVERYLSMITSVTRQDDTFTCYLSTPYAIDLLTKNYSEGLKKCLELISSKKTVALSFVYDESARPALILPTQGASHPQTKTAKISTFVSTMPLNEEYTFEEFVRGPSNSFALSAAQAVVSNPGKSSYNPLFIHGGTGLGKTHLMQAIGNRLKKTNPGLAICYLTAEEYLNEYVNSLTHDNIQAFRTKYRSVDILLLDDVQFFKTRKAVQEEFFNTFNALQQSKKQIVMTSDVAPKNMPEIESRLISRFEGGMLQEIESPAYETRLAILKKKAEGLQPPMKEETLQFIAHNIKSHVRAIEGALSRVSIFANRNPSNGDSQNQLTEEVLSYILKDYIEKEKSRKKLTVDEVQNCVCRKYGVSMTQILSTERTQSIVTPRQLAMYISRKFTMHGLTEIAQHFDKSHATIIHGVKTISKRLDVEPDLRRTLEEIISELGCTMNDMIEQ